MLSRSSLSTCRSALVRAPTKHLLQVARESTTTAAAPEPPKEEAKPAPKKRSIPLATGFEDLFAAKPLAPAPSRNSASDSNNRSQQRGLGRGARQGDNQGRSYGAIDFTSLGDDEFDGRLTGGLALRLQRHQKQVSKAAEPKVSRPAPQPAPLPEPTPGTPATADAGNVEASTVPVTEDAAPHQAPDLRQFVNFGAGPNTYENLVLPKGVQNRLEHPERPQNANARGQPRADGARQERRPRPEGARQERRPRTEGARQERRPRTDDRFAGAADALMGSAARMQGQAQEGQQRQRRESQPRSAAAKTSNRQTRPRTATAGKTSSNAQRRPRRQTRARDEDTLADDLAVKNFKYDVTFVAQDAEPQVLSPEALTTLFAQPVQALQASMPLLKSLSTLPEPADVTKSEPEPETKEQKPPHVDRAQVRRALETIGGAYTRYVPAAVQHAARQTPAKAGPVLYAHLALARRPDVSLARRQQALGLVSKLVAQTDTTVVAQPQA